MPRKLRLFDQVRERLLLKHYSIRTEQAYLGWMKRFVLFHGLAGMVWVGACTATG
jgi:hypothetical protein